MSLRREESDGIVTLTLDVPEKRNALTSELRLALREALIADEADPAVRAIVMTGANGAFCAGGDISAMSGSDPMGARSRLGTLHDVVRLLAAGRKPTVAAVSGAAAGGGFGLAVACDWVIADRTAKFASSFGKIGLMPDMGILWTLPRRVGAAKARQLFLDARMVMADEALGLGIADEVVEPEALMAAARAKAEAAAALAPLPVGFLKQALAGRSMTFEQVLEVEMDAQPLLMATQDHAEAREAFFAKRPPKYAGA